MLLLGIDIDTYLVKAYVFNAENQVVIGSDQYSDGEPLTKSPQAGLATQSPGIWWQQTQQALALYNKKGCYHAKIFFQLLSFIR